MESRRERKKDKKIKKKGSPNAAAVVKRLAITRGAKRNNKFL